MNKDNNHEDYRRQLWIDIAIAYVNAPNSVDKDGAVNWSNHILDGFDEKFNSVKG